jgi:hypothetical protein
MKRIWHVISCMAFFRSTDARGENISPFKNHSDATECMRVQFRRAPEHSFSNSMKARLCFRVHRADGSLTEVEKVTRRGRVCVRASAAPVIKRRVLCTRFYAQMSAPGRSTVLISRAATSKWLAFRRRSLEPRAEQISIQACQMRPRKYKDRRGSAVGCEMMTVLGLIFLGNNDDEIPRATVNIFFFTLYDECP